ncbi:5946_t:CDS:2, partial [Acaulospora morrowiae]
IKVWLPENRDISCTIIGKFTQGGKIDEKRLTHRLVIDEGELDFLIKDCTDAGTFAGREKCPLEFILTYYEGHQPQYTHLRASMLAYAHINLLEMLQRFDPNEVVRIATDSIYVRKEALYKIENTPAFFKQVEVKFCFGEWFYRPDSYALSHQPEEQEIQEIQPGQWYSIAPTIYDLITRCRKSYLNGGGESGKTTRAIRIFKDINMIIFTHTNALAKDFREKRNVKAQTWHSFFRWNGVGEWTPERMEEKKFLRVVIWDEVICCGDDAQSPPFFGEMPHNWLKEHADYYEEVLTDYRAKCPKLRKLKKAMRRKNNRIQSKLFREILPTIEKWECLEKEWTPSDRILSAHRLSRRIASQKCFELHHIKYPDTPVPLIYRLRDGRKQNCLIQIPVWVIDEHLAWDNLIYLAVGRVEYLSQLIRVEGPPLPPEIKKAKNKKAIKCLLRSFISGKLVGYMDQDKKKGREFDLSVDYILTLKDLQKDKCALCLLRWNGVGMMHIIKINGQLIELITK